ncbi:UDP-3-O-acyl-N-acetylglucosamine deacetylase [Rubripirellula lacrimiformis]|uniref:UDP-3-O-acyl-N-acetylglucosamine deacetylase n=1 Tax=Rubripirellula lacrimiformis TaxID=1930273 RepID=UPI00119CB09C|nr:UDP-3-O-acyl-N-acetylglucosamine deacetylase [Rubripirellula lacrimiformis]
MHRSRNEHTTAVTCEIHGRGYWSGKEVTVRVHPAPLGTGICLVRCDLPNRPQCVATVDHREDANLRTNLVHGAAQFQMVEHLMAALAALEIDNCIAEINAEELPALDGSSLAFVEALSHAGLVIQAKAKPQLIIRDRYRVGSSDGWVEAMPSKDGECYYEYQLSFDDETPIAPQAFGMELTPDRFIREIAPARTFVTSQQAEKIRATGMASHVTNQDLVVIGPSGPIDNVFRYSNECARHKTLDLIGDLALSGIELIGRFTSFRGGHNLNGRMAKQLAELATEQMALPSATSHETSSHRSHHGMLHSIENETPIPTDRRNAA